MIAVLPIFWTAALAATPHELLPAGSSWSFLDDGTPPDTSWIDPGYDDTGWSEGPAPLGYGHFGVTEVGFGGDPTNVHPTTWFRTTFVVDGDEPIEGLTMDLQRDDGAVVYLNGVEVHRANLPTPSDASSLALVEVSGLEETTNYSFAVDPDLLLDGANQLAVEVHQVSLDSDDLVFDLAVTGWTGAAAVVRGPYLQNVTPTSAVVRWRTDRPAAGRVTLDSGDEAVTPVGTEHSAHLTNLDTSTTYSYSIEADGSVISSTSSGVPHQLTTAPSDGETGPFRVWVLGDSGTANDNAEAVRDAFLGLDEPADVWLMLGDNAYNSGTDAEYQRAVFDVYDMLLPHTPLWSTLGNHDGYSASSATQTGPYYDIFDLPTAAEAGGSPSGTEAYYSFDWGHVHFVCLDSYDSERAAGSAMFQWLEDDLSATQAQWIIAFWHHPPYSRGSHDSDLEFNLSDMRRNALPILEAHGVDLVLSGHSHSYERSFLVDGHYDLSTTFDPSMLRDASSGDPAVDGPYVKPSAIGGSHEGAVYAVAGSSGQISGGRLDHPVMHTNLNELGSMVLDIDGDELRARFVDDAGQVLDAFTILRGAASVRELRADGDAVEGTPVALTALAADGDGAEAAAYVWDFGDGASGVGSEVQHAWPDDGTWTVTVEATMPDGTVTRRAMQLPVANADPVIGEVRAVPATAGTAVTLVGEATDAPGDVLNFAWTLGDGGLRSGKQVTHTYPAPGTYTATLTVTDDDGGSSTKSLALNVGETSAEEPTAAPPMASDSGGCGCSVDDSNPTTHPIGGLLPWFRRR